MTFQDLYNKAVTTALLLYAMSIYTYAYVTNKPLNIPELLGWLVPLASQLITSLTQAHLVTKNADVKVAELQNSGPLPAVKPEVKV